METTKSRACEGCATYLTLSTLECQPGSNKYKVSQCVRRMLLGQSILTVPACQKSPAPYFALGE